MTHYQQLESPDRGASAPEDLEALFTGYVALCNRALAENEHKLWFRPAKRLSVALCGGANFRTIVYDRRPSEGLAEFFLHFDPQSQALEILPAREHPVAFTWTAPVDYLRDVVEARPRWYLDNPLMLDWSWIRARVRDEAAKRVDGQVLTLAFLLGAAYAVRSRRRR